MSIVMDAACLQCSLRRNLAVAEPLGSPEETMGFARDLMRLYLEGPKDVPSTWHAPQIARLLHERYGLEIDRFRQEKLVSSAEPRDCTVSILRRRLHCRQAASIAMLIVLCSP